MRNNSFTGLFTIILLWFFILPNGMKDRPNTDGQTINCTFSQSTEKDAEKESFSQDKQLFSSFYVETVSTVPGKTTSTNNNKEQFLSTISYKKDSSTNVQISNYLLYTNSLHSTDHIKLQRFNI